jgi:competence protein ComEA
MKRSRRYIVLTLVTALLLIFAPTSWAEEGEKININQASVQEIAELKGIGMSYAERIVQYRKDNGPFQSPEDIVKVRGIGPKALEANKDRITVK